MPISTKLSPQEEMGIIIANICNGTMTVDWEIAKDRLRTSIEQGANPNNPIKMNKDFVLPVEALVIAATGGRAHSSDALGVLIEDQSKIPDFFLNVNDPRQPLNGLSPLEFIVKHSSQNPPYSACMAATLIAGEVRVLFDVEPIAANAPQTIATAIRASAKRPKSARQFQNERHAGLA
jgi:hypothetical protein